MHGTLGTYSFNLSTQPPYKHYCNWKQSRESRKDKLRRIDSFTIQHITLQKPTDSDIGIRASWSLSVDLSSPLTASLLSTNFVSMDFSSFRDSVKKDIS